MKYLFSFLLVCLFTPLCLAGTEANNSVKWTKCPAYLEGPENLQCTTLKQPLNHDDPTGKQIDILLVRALGKSEVKKGEVWFVAGGPGGSISALSPVMDIWSRTHPEYDYYAMEHRGVGYSTYLSCEGKPDLPTKQCRDELIARWGEGLGFFNPTQAAHDLAASMKRVGVNSEKYLYGISYGTYLVQRFISIYDSMLKGAIIDGVVPAGLDENGLSPLDTYDNNYNEMALSIAKMCDDDETCSVRLQTFGTDTASVIKSTFASIDECRICDPLKKMITKKRLRTESAELISNYWGRLLYPALIYRINRCEPKDVEALSKIFEEDDEPEPEDKYLHFSINLNTNIAVSLLMTKKSLAIAEQETPNYIAAPDALIDTYTLIEKVKWPQFPHDQYTEKWPETDLPILILTGDMDPQTPLSFAKRAKTHYTGTNQYMIVLPGAPHGSLIWSPLKNVPIDDANSCGVRVMFNFITDVTKEPEASCIDDMLLPEFSGKSEAAKTAAGKFFDTEDIWD